MSQEQGRGLRRGREDAEDGGSGGGGSGSEGQRAAKRQAGDVLAGLRFEGPAWRLRAAGGGGGGEGDEHRLRGCEGMLQQALECSELADVRFVFDDGLSSVGGHRALLSSVSEVFAGMFRSGMEESESGKVRVRGVSRQSFEAFLEYAYVGRCGSRAGMADGRELWVLAEVFQVDGLKEWLVREGVWGMESACSAMQYARSAAGAFEELRAACERHAHWDLAGATEAGLRGVGVEAASALLASHSANKRLWRGCDVLERFRFAERWVRANGGVEGVDSRDITRMVTSLELNKLPLHTLSHIVRPSGLVGDSQLFDLAARIHERLQRDMSFEGLAFELTRMFGLGSSKPSHVAVDEGGGEPLLAASHFHGGCVRVFSLGSGEEVRTIGPEVVGLGRLGRPTGLIFNARGELLVCDHEFHRIVVFGRDGGYVRSIGGAGAGAGELRIPLEMAMSAQGHVVVSDLGNQRVQVLREDGTFVRAMGARGSGEGQLHSPHGLCLGPDGSVLVADPGRACVVVFDSEGAFVRTIGSRGNGAGEFQEPFGVCVLGGGQVLVSDRQRHEVQVFSWEGGYLRSIGEDGDSYADIRRPYGLTVDSGGRVFVAAHGSHRVHMLSRAGA